MAINQGGAMHPQTKPNRQNNKQPNKTDNLPPHYGVQSAGFIVYRNRNEQHLVVKKMVYVFNNVFPRTRDAPFWNDQSLRVFYNIRSSIPSMGGVDIILLWLNLFESCFCALKKLTHHTNALGRLKTLNMKVLAVFFRSQIDNQ